MKCSINIYCRRTVYVTTYDSIHECLVENANSFSGRPFQTGGIAEIRGNPHRLGNIVVVIIS